MGKEEVEKKEKKDTSVSNFWTVLGSILIGLGALGLFATIGSSSNSSGSAAGASLFGNIISMAYTLPIYAIIAGILCYIVGYLRAIFLKLAGDDNGQKEEGTPGEKV